MPTGERRRSKRAPNRGLMKPVQRWVPAFSEDRCATHDGRGIGPNGESYPDAHGWDCGGCRWAPPHVARRNRLRERMDDVLFASLTGDTAALERMGLGVITIDAPVDKPADNPEVIHSVGLVMGPEQLEQLKGDPDWQLVDLDAFFPPEVYR